MRNVWVPGFVLSWLLPSCVHGQTSASSSSYVFVCPEQSWSDAQKQAELSQFLTLYKQEHPGATVRDVMIDRFTLLKQHHCLETLKAMLGNVTPLTEVLSFEGSDYGPKTEQFNEKTKVWSVFFRKDAEPSMTSSQDLILNFYGFHTGRTPEQIAQAFLQQSDGRVILGKFQAPDRQTGKPAFFIVSETPYTDQKIAYLNISKITSVATGAYAVTFDKVFKGGTTQAAEEKAKGWFLSDEGQTTARSLGRVGISSEWEAYLNDDKHASSH